MIRGIRYFLCLFIFVLGLTRSLEAQRANKRPKIEILREIDIEEGVQRLNAFRKMWVIGDMSLKYSLQFIPRRGKRREMFGTLWGSNSLKGPVSLIQVHGEPDTQLYLQSGRSASVFKRINSESAWDEVEVADWFNSIDDQVTLTAFDLMMPFIYWPEWNYEGVTKVNSRVAHAFLMKAPSAMNGNPLDLQGVIVYLDESFNALLKAEYLSSGGEVLRSLRLIDLKKVDGVWLPKTIDFLDEASRDKTRLRIREAAVHLDFSSHPLGAGAMPGSVPEIPLSQYKEVR